MVAALIEFVNELMRRKDAAEANTPEWRAALDTLVLKNARENDGRAEFLFSIREVFLGNSALLKGLELVGQSEFAKSLQGEIRESRVAAAQDSCPACHFTNASASAAGLVDWSPQAARQWDDFRWRLGAHGPRLAMRRWRA